MVLISIVATETSAVTFLSVPGLGYNPKGGNLTFLQLSFGYIIGRCLVAWFLLPQYMRGDLFSAYQVLRERFGPAVQRVASGLFLITRTIADGLRIFLTALAAQFVDWSMETAIVVVGVVTIVYTYLGGMKAVIWTDLIQFVIKIAGAVLAFVFVLKLLPGGWNQFLAEGEAAGKFKMIEAAFEPTVAYNFWAGVIGGAVFSMASHGADQLMVQRYLCAKSLGQARLALVLSGFVILVQFLLFLAVGVGMYVLAGAGLFPEAASATSNDEVFPLFIVPKMPTGVVGILIAAVLAAAMSTLSSSLNSSANALVTDFYRPLRPHHSEKWYVLVSRVMTAVWGVAQMGVAYVAYQMGSNDSVVNRVLAVAGCDVRIGTRPVCSGQPAEPSHVAVGARRIGGRSGGCARRLAPNGSGSTGSGMAVVRAGRSRDDGAGCADSECRWRARKTTSGRKVAERHLGTPVAWFWVLRFVR